MGVRERVCGCVRGATGRDWNAAHLVIQPAFVIRGVQFKRNSKNFIINFIMFY